MDKISPDDLRMWVDTGSCDPWITLREVIRKLDKRKEEIKAFWGGPGEVIVNGKSYKR